MLQDNNPNGYGYTEPDTEPEEINYDDPNPNVEAEYELTKNKRSELDLILSYEEGDISYEDYLELFSRLIKNGHAWQLQGFYGREAMRLINSKTISTGGKIL